jgi:hypothetical protein
MLGYYLELATRSLRRNVVLTVLMIAAVGVGIGASMTMLTTLRVMSRDPIPDKSSVLFAPQNRLGGTEYRSVVHHRLAARSAHLPRCHGLYAGEIGRAADGHVCGRNGPRAPGRSGL